MEDEQHKIKETAEVELLETMAPRDEPDISVSCAKPTDITSFSKDPQLLNVIEHLQKTATGKQIRSELRQKFASVQTTILKLKDSLQIINSLTSFEDIRTAIHLKEIDNIAQSVNKQDLKTYADLITKHCFVECFCRIWNTLDRFSNAIDLTQLIIKTLLLNSAIQFSDISPDFCERFGDSGALMCLFNELNLDALSVAAVDRCGNTLKWNSPREYTKRILVIMNNMLKNCERHRILFRDANVAPLLVKFLKCSFMLMRCKALFVLSYIVIEDEQEKLNTSGENIKYLVKILQDAMKSKHHFSKRYTFSVVDVLGAIIRLATHDENKDRFIQSDILPLLQVLLTNVDNSGEELRKTALVVWSLSFTPNNKSIIKSSSTFISALKNLLRIDDPDIKSACQGALWELDENTTTEVGNTTPRTNDHKTKHIMISYQWDVQWLIIKVKDHLERAGYKVWIDIEKMGGSTLETMAKAIEDAVVVLICYTEKYKDSSNCRSEAEYVYKLKKDVVPLKLQNGYRPDGWLGILIGTKLWFDMSTEERLQQNIASLIKELGSRGHTVVVMKDNARTSPPLNVDMKGGGHEVHTMLSCNQPIKRVFQFDGEAETKQNNVLSWTNHDVMIWLKDQGLSAYTDLKDFDGRTILGLQAMANDAPEFFFKSIKKNLRIKSLVDMIKLREALNKLK